jgi:protein phosphatase
VARLVDAANSSGGRDNITAVAFRVAERGEGGRERGGEGATLIGRTAEQAGLTGERMRQAADRVRGRGPMPPSRRGRRALRIALVLLAVAALIAVAVVLARQVYFLGTDEDGRVAMFRGLPYDLPLGIELYSEQESIGVPVSSLSPERQDVVTEHELRSHDDAQDLLDDIEQTEGTQPPTPAPTPAPKPAPKKKRTAKAKAGSGQQP